MKVDFYYIDKEYIEFLKDYEIKNRKFTCVPNIEYANRDKFVYGTVLEIDKIKYYVPVSSKTKGKEDDLLICDKNNVIKGSLRFAYMIPVPNSCISNLRIDDILEPNRKILISKELAFCRRNKDKINKQALKTYNRIVNKVNEHLVNNSCDFKLLEQAYIEYCKQKDIEVSTDLQKITDNNFYKKSNLSAEQVTVLAKTGIPFNCKKIGENNFTIVFERTNSDKVIQALNTLSEQEQPSHQPRLKR